MSEATLSLACNGVRLRLTYPLVLKAPVEALFVGHGLPETDEADIELRLDERPGGWDIQCDRRPIWRNLPPTEALCIVAAEIERAFAVTLIDPVLQAAALLRDRNAILLAGPPGCGKSGLAYWLGRRGFSHLADNFASIGAKGSVTGLALPACLFPEAAASVAAHAEGLHASVKTMLAPPHLARDHRLAHPCGLIIVPEQRLGAAFSMELLAPGKALLRIQLALHPEQGKSAAMEEQLAALARTTPVLLVRFENHGQLTGVFDELVRLILDGNLDTSGIRQLLGAYPHRTNENALPHRTEPIRSRSPRIAGSIRPLAIGMATYDDYDGVYFTIQALRLFHRELAEDIDFIVVDNNPSSASGEAVRKFASQAGCVSYVPAEEKTGTAVRDFVMSEAANEVVMCLDCHVLVVPGALSKLLRYFKEHPGSRDLVQGPMVDDSLNGVLTHWQPGWNGGMYGTWASDPRGQALDGDAFDIPMQGLGLYACRRAAWPGFNPHFRGFGGEEGYIHEKFRQRGGRTLCLPFLRWLHRFERPLGVPYQVSWHDRIRNYMIGHDELGLPMDGMLDHFHQHLGPTAGPIIRQTHAEIERLRG